MPPLSKLLGGHHRPLTDEDKAWAAQIRAQDEHPFPIPADQLEEHLVP